MRSFRQPVATEGNGIYDRLRSVATTGLHEGSIVRCLVWRRKVGVTVGDFAAPPAIPDTNGVSAGDGIEPPLTGQALELRRAAALEHESRTGDEILDGARDEDFAGLRLFGDSRADVDCDAADLAVDELAFAGEEAGADLKSEFADRFGDRAGAADGACGAVEACEESVAGDVEFGAAEADKLSADQRVMTLEQFPPGAVAELGRSLRGADDVREKDGRENPLRFGLGPAAGLPHLLEEPFNFVGDQHRGVSPEREMPGAGYLGNARGGDPRCHVLRNLSGHERVVGAVQDQRWHAHRRQHVAHVDLFVHSMQRDERTGARPEPEQVQRGLLLVAFEAAKHAHGLARLLARPEDAEIPFEL